MHQIPIPSLLNQIPRAQMKYRIDLTFNEILYVSCSEIPIVQKVKMFDMPSIFRAVNAEIIFNSITKVDKINRV